jgi:hypothetical protein
MRRVFIILLIGFGTINYQALFGQKTVRKAESGGSLINWNPVQQVKCPDGTLKSVLSFQDALYVRDFSSLPYLTEKKLISANEEMTAEIEVLQTAPLNDNETSVIQNMSLKESDFLSETYIIRARNEKYSCVNILPVRKNKTNGSFEKLVSYRLTWRTSGKKITAQTLTTPFAASSVLASGTWFKFSIGKTGVYKIDKSFLNNLGIDVTSLVPANLRIFGNGGRILPELNTAFRYDDLNEIAISVAGESDGAFDNSDYILFYAKGPEEWDYTGSGPGLKFNYIKNYYSDSSFYFLTIDNGPGKRIGQQASLTVPYNYSSSSYDDYAVHELESSNLVKSGRDAFGEYFDINTSYPFIFNLPNLTQNDTAMIKTSIAGRTFSGTADFRITHSAGTYTINCPATGSTYLDDVGKEKAGIAKFINSNTSNISVTIDKLTSSATGWLNYILLNVRRDLIVSGGQLLFRDSRNIAPGNITRFSISSSSANTVTWDVSDPFNVQEQLCTQPANGIYEFIAATPSLKEYITHGGNSYLIPNLIGQIPNQNLHATQPVDYIIITHPLFKAEAQRLADLHSQYDTLSYVIATTDEIYHEFSSGAQDITAVRDFIRMIYNRANAANLPKYVLLFGDGSYDNIHRYLSNNTNYIPTYQTYNSLSYIGSFGSDDFYGFMDDTEGDFNNSDVVDIGVGRLPAHSATEANNLVNKIIHYYRRDANFDPYSSQTGCSAGNESSFGEWRNWICFIADDANDSWEKTFVSGSETFANYVSVTDKNYNIDKIYLDSYKQESTPGGERYPDANEAFDKRVEKGALIINYSGHGGETGLAHENVLDIPQIMHWDNLNNLPMFLTATCEFSRYDDPARTSAGEEILLHSSGGGIALFTTTRVAFASDGDVLCPNFFTSALVPLGNKMPLLGDIIRLAKFKSGPGYRHFTLLGDPAVLLSYPKQSVTTTQVNISPAGTTDTLSALEKVTITGYVSDRAGNKLTGYNGLVYPTVFDKSVKYATLGNDLGAAGIMNFFLQKNVLYKGKALVTNGDFSFTFIVPKDISYQYGPGRISYYALNGDIDAAGYYDKVIIGGSDTTAAIDAIGPEVKLYMNDNHFVFGGTTNENPHLYAEVFDSSGINTVGNGIGHDLVAILDANSSKPYVLNDYYQSDLNSYQSGKINYPFNELSEGTHDLSLKVWDIQNNSSGSITQFVVSSSADLALKHVLNYPNPFTTNTKFFVEHNQCCVGLNVEIQVFTVSGKIVKTLNKNVTNEGYRTDGIEWDGKDDFGDKIGRGVYVYRVKVKTTDGKSSEKFEKLVILN